MPEIVHHGHNGRLARPRGSVALVDADRVLLAQDAQVSVMVDQAARTAKENFPWAANTQKTFAAHQAAALRIAPEQVSRYGGKTQS